MLAPAPDAASAVPNPAGNPVRAEPSPSKLVAVITPVTLIPELFWKVTADPTVTVLPQVVIPETSILLVLILSVAATPVRALPSPNN